MTIEQQMNKDEMINLFMTYLKEHREVFPNISDETIRGILEKEIKEIEYIEQDGLVVGGWNPDKGKLEIVNGEEAIHRIIHEFIHLLSTSKNDKDGSLKVGLNIFYKEKNIDIGIGLNEGITDAIAEIVSGRKNTGYQVEKNAAYMLFALLGKDTVLKKFYDNKFLENVNVNSDFRFSDFFEEDILSMYDDPQKKQEVRNLVNEMSKIVDKITNLNQEFKQRK